MSDAARRTLAEAMLADVVAAASAVGPVLVVAPAAHGPAGGRARSSPIRAAARAQPSAPVSTAATAAGLPGPYLVVNADLPCATARDLLALAGACSGRRPRARRGRRRDDERARLRRRRACSSRSTAPGAQSASPRWRPSRRSTRRISLMTWTRSTISRGSADRVGAHTRRVLAALDLRVGSVNVAVLSGGVGGARFLRGLVGCRRSRQRFHHRQRCGRHRGARAACLARSRQHPLHAHRPLRRGARLGSRRRELACARHRDASSAARRGSGSATATSACISCARELLRDGAPLCEATDADRARARPRARSCCPRPTIRCARSSRRRPARSRSRRGSSRAAIATRSMRCTTPARPRRSPRPASLDALARRRRDPDRAEQPVRLDRPDPRGRRDPRRARASARCRASRSARSSAVAR